MGQDKTKHHDFQRAEQKERVQPIDHMYAPGAASPKYVCPPECTVIKQEIESGSGLHNKMKKLNSRYTSVYDVWVLSWTWLQMIVGERWCDWDPTKKTCTLEEGDPLKALLKKFFYDKKLQVETEWELSGETDAPKAWKLGLLAADKDGTKFKSDFLEPFFKIISERLKKGKLTPMQKLFVDSAGEGGGFQGMLSAMLDFDQTKREALLISGE